MPHVVCPFLLFPASTPPPPPQSQRGGLRALGGLGVTVTLIPQGPGCQGRASWSIPVASCGMFLEPET